MFGKKKNQKALMEMISSYNPTSKSSLKMFCMVAAKGDVKQASELYEFMIKDMEDLPMFDPKPPTAMENAKGVITGIFDFFKENKEGLSQGYDLLRGFMASRGKNLPPLGGSVTEAASESLPTIN